MRNWIKKKLRNQIEAFLRTELQAMKNELLAELKKEYRELRWQEFLQDKSIEKIIHPVNDKISINLYKDNYLSPLIFSNQFEEDIISFITSNLQAGDCFVDIGANIGLFSLLASPVVSFDGLVLSFEPTGNTFNRFDENIKHNAINNIRAHQIALSDYEGAASFNVSTDGHDAFNSFSLPQYGSNYNQETVDVKLLDSFFDKLEPYKNRILMKVDVEGWEYNVIKGAGKILQELSPIMIIEFNDENTQNSPFKCTDVYSLIQSYGYELFSLINGTLIKKENEEYFGYQNLIAKKAASNIK